MSTDARMCMGQVAGFSIVLDLFVLFFPFLALSLHNNSTKRKKQIKNFLFTTDTIDFYDHDCTHINVGFCSTLVGVCAKEKEESSNDNAVLNLNMENNVTI